MTGLAAPPIPGRQLFVRLTSGRRIPSRLAFSQRAARPRRLVGVLAFSLLVAAALGSGAAHADPAQELASLFMQSCLPYAGAPVALRAWATHAGLPVVPEPARSAFLHGAPGQVFDGSSDEGKFVLVSSDDGICSAIAAQTTQPPAIDALEADLRTSGIAFRLVIERDDAAIQTLHDREYLATRNGRSWRILLATVKGDQGGQAMLTTAPE